MVTATCYDNPMNEIVIVGGGVAGLMAGLHLAERGLQPLILEAEPRRVGGRLRDEAEIVFEQAGRSWRFPAEHGVHGIWSPYHNFCTALARHNLLPELLPAREETWVFGRGRLIRRAPIGSAIRGSLLPAPFHYLYCFLRPSFLNMLNLHDVASLLRVFAGLCAAMAIDPLAEHKALKGMSLADFTNGWSPALRSLFAGLARSALSAHPEEIPVSGFIAFLRFYTLLRRDAWAFGYLQGTGGALIAEPLADAARRLGCQIRLGTRVESLCYDGARWTLLLATAAGTVEQLSADRVILAVDAPAAGCLLAESGLAGAGLLEFPRGMPTALVRIWFDCQPRPGAEAGIFSGDFVMDNFFWLDRLQPAYREWSATTGGSALECHVYGPPELLAQPDAALLAQVVTDVERAFPELRGRSVQRLLQRNLATHTLFSVGEPGAHLGVMTPWTGLYACGDWVYHPAPALYLERATITGIAAANAVLQVYGLEPWPLLAAPKPEPLAGALSGGLTRLRHWMLAQRVRRAVSTASADSRTLRAEE